MSLPLAPDFTMSAHMSPARGLAPEFVPIVRLS